MSDQRFKTPEVAQLYEEVSALCHPEHPFLDPNYSPGSNAPALDLTPHVTTWLRDGREDAIAELWNLLTCSGEGSLYVLKQLLRARLPDWMDFSETARNELRAIYLLTLRAAGKPNVGIDLAATTLACRQMTIDPALTNLLIDLARSELIQEGDDSDSTEEDHDSVSVEECNEAAKQAIAAVISPLGKAELAAERLKAVPPMVRYVVADYVHRGWSNGMLRLNLYYDHRMYGCGAEFNQQYLNWLGFFGSPDDKAPIHSSITKEILREALGQNGIQCKASSTRAAMIEAARGVTGLVSGLLARHCPQHRELLPAWKEAVVDWANRVKAVEPVAAALLKFIALSSIKATEKPFFRGLSAESIFETASRIRNGAQRFMSDQTDIEFYPAWELARTYERELPRGFRRGADGELIPAPGQDWPNRWRAAAKQSRDDTALRILDETGRMVALKSSGIWQALGDGTGGYTDTLGNPFPPFAYDSGFDTSGVPRSECIELGLLKKGEALDVQVVQKQV